MDGQPYRQWGSSSGVVSGSGGILVLVLQECSVEGELMAMVRRSELVDALAAVAVSALSGPLGAIGVSAAGELVKLLRNARGRTSEERELRQQVRGAITAWAKGERLDPDVVDRGLAWAIEYVQAAGCQHELIADADFDPTRAAEVVLTPAKARDEYWGTDPEYGVAERAVHVTYHALCPPLTAQGVGEPRVSGRTDADLEDVLSLDCTVGHLLAQEGQAREALAPALGALDAMEMEVIRRSGLVAPGVDEDTARRTFRRLIAPARLRGVLGLVGASAEEMDSLDQWLRRIPNRR